MKHAKAFWTIFWASMAALVALTFISAGTVGLTAAALQMAAGMGG